MVLDQAIKDNILNLDKTIDQLAKRIALTETEAIDLCNLVFLSVILID